ncbi:MAG: hypothetical protein ACFCUR_21730 [Rhodomicrobiaceae bacterium]
MKRTKLSVRVLLALTALLAAPAVPANATGIPPLPVKQFSSPEQRQAVADYVAQYEAHLKALARHEKAADSYWQLISSKRTERRRRMARDQRIRLSDYVLEQPPAFSGPEMPARPDFLPPALERKKKKRPGDKLPVVKDFLRYAKARYDFVPELPAREIDYKRAYARTALAAGISKDQAVRIYGFEASGNGLYDVQAGLESGKPGGRAISTALGYNQLLVANTIGLVSKYGGGFIEELKDRAARSDGEKRERLNRKIAGLRKMIRYARSMPYRWSDHVRASRGSRGRGLHALILDVDIGPLLQTQKLLNSIQYAKRRGYDKELTAAELEMLNLTGDGNGYDMIALPQSMREKVPTANFFQRNGYERNPVASRNNTVAALLEATSRHMDYHAALDGGKQMAAAFDEVMNEARVQ